MWSKRLLFLSLLTVALAACVRNPAEVRTPLLGYTQPIREYHFDSVAPDWNTFYLADNSASFTLSDSTLLGQVASDRGYVWSLNQHEFGDVSIKATIRQVQGSEGNGFGVMCRADEAGNGYYFAISSARAFAILKAEPGVADPSELVKWQNSRAVRPGTQSNEIEGICVDDYLALIINGIFVAEIRDTTFKDGQIGLVLGAVGKPLGVAFDDIVVREARVIGG